MQIIHRKSISSFRNRVISLAVLVGFLCIQFHSFSHIDLDILVTDHKTHQSENASSHSDDHSSPEKSKHSDCPDCTFAKHLQADLTQSNIFIVSHSFQIVADHLYEPAFEFPHHIYRLRAPPVSAV